MLVFRSGLCGLSENERWCGNLRCGAAAICQPDGHVDARDRGQQSQVNYPALNELWEGQGGGSAGWRNYRMGELMNAVVAVKVLQEIEII